MRRTDVYVAVGGVDQLAGTLTVRGRGDLARSQFVYDPEFAYGGQGFDLAPGLPVDDPVHGFRGIPLFVQDAGPDLFGALTCYAGLHSRRTGWRRSTTWTTSSAPATSPGKERSASPTPPPARS